MTDDVMKKVESLLYDEDEVPEEPKRKPEIIEEPEESEKVIEKPIEKLKEKPKKEPIEKGMSMIEIFFDGKMEIQGAKIKIVPGGEVESGNIKFVFSEDSVKVYEI